MFFFVVGLFCVPYLFQYPLLQENQNSSDVEVSYRALQLAHDALHEACLNQSQCLKLEFIIIFSIIQSKCYKSGQHL